MCRSSSAVTRAVCDMMREDLCMAFYHRRCEGRAIRRAHEFRRISSDLHENPRAKIAESANVSACAYAGFEPQLFAESRHERSPQQQNRKIVGEARVGGVALDRVDDRGPDRGE